jgi:hypothetical protein
MISWRWPCSKLGAEVTVDGVVQRRQVIPDREVTRLHPKLTLFGDVTCCNSRGKSTSLSTCHAVQTDRAGADQQSRAPGMPVRTHHGLLDGDGHPRAIVVCAVAVERVVNGDNRLQQAAHRLGQIVAGSLGISPQGATADLGHNPIRQRHDTERQLPPGTTDVPGVGGPSRQQVEGLHKAVSFVPGLPQRVVERVVPDSHRLDLLVRQQVLVAEDQHLVPP